MMNTKTKGDDMEDLVKFELLNYDRHNMYFEGYKNKSGRYVPLKKFVVDKYRVGYIEVENTHKGCEFLSKEVKEI